MDPAKKTERVDRAVNNFDDCCEHMAENMYTVQTKQAEL